MKQVYLDNAATTALSPEVFSAMKPYFGKKYGNASEPHTMGQEARLAVEQSRLKLARFLGCGSEEIIFTGSATESINLSHKGLLEGILTSWNGPKKPHIITCQIEHMAVLETVKHLERSGLVDVTFLPVDQYGLVNVTQVEKTIRKETVLVSIMYVNNEVGTIEPVREIGLMLKKVNTQRKNLPKIYFHTDATQGIQYLNCRVDYLGVDFLSLTGHKIYAPKGVGALYTRKSSTLRLRPEGGTPCVPQMDGGGQEGRMRAGTENVPYIVALGKAIEMCGRWKIEDRRSMEKLRDKLITGILKIPGVKLTGHPEKRAPHIASFVIEGVEGESLVLLLSDQGIYASSGSACTSDKLTASHVLTAMGVPEEVSHGSIRFSLGKNTNISDIDYVVQTLPGIVQRLRSMAPVLDIL